MNGFKADVPVFKVGEKIVVNVIEKIRMDNAVTFEGSATTNGILAVTTKLNTVEVDSPKSSLNMK